ncbi:unnamed protein product [Gadus morhua 'NCC']
MEDHGYYRSYVQCRDKLKKLKSDYKAIKDQNGRSGSNRKSWKWYDQMDTIYGHRPANNGRESGIDSAMGLLEEIDNDDFLCTTEEGGLVNIDSDEPPAAASTPPPPTPTEPPSPTSSTTDKRKRSLSQQEHSAQVTDCLRDMHADDIAQQDGTLAQ